ncbi:WAT1-related protein, partial [Cucurbita argyrosperma subsp. sororia]
MESGVGSSGVGSSGVGSSGTTICTNGAFHATAKPALLMLLVQSVFAGVNVLYKLAVNDGMNLMIMIAFRFVFASLFMLPLAFFLERNKRPKMTCSILFYGFLCGLFGYRDVESKLVRTEFGNDVSNICFGHAESLSGYYLPSRPLLRDGKVGDEEQGRGGQGGRNVSGDWWGHVSYFLQRHPDQHLVNPRGPPPWRTLGTSSSKSSPLPQFCAWKSAGSRQLPLLLFLAHPSDKNDENISMPILEHRVDVCDGSNSGVGDINLCREGLEAMEIGLEYQASHRCICRDRGVGSHGDADGVVRTYERATVCVYFQPSYASPGSYCWIPMPPRKLAPWQCDWSSADCVWFIHGVVGQKQRDEQHTSIERR